MKKTYNKPELSIFCVHANCDPSDIVAGSPNSTIEKSEDLLSKDRDFEEDNEAFNVTDGEGMASYGDLW